MSHIDLTMVKHMSVLDKIKALPHYSNVGELEKLIGSSKLVINSLKKMKNLFVYSEKKIKQQQKWTCKQKKKMRR